jgi:hypothetical protein
MAAKQPAASSSPFFVRQIAAVRELVEGSLSHEVAEHARRPVLVVPRNEPPLS